MRKVKIDLLAFEVTRRCNQNCAHCLKGKSQNIDLETEMIDRLFRSDDHKITEMRHFSMTGGEPTLVPNVIEYLIDTMIKLDVSVTEHVIFLTNGLIYDEKIIRAINRMMDHLSKKKNCQNVQLVFELSNDQFHKRPDREILDKYRKLQFLDESFLKPRIIEDIMNEGNAKENGIGGNKTYQNFIKQMDIRILNDQIEIKNELLVSANGNIVNVGCTSYIEEDRIALGNLHEISFLNMMERYTKSAKL